MWTSFVFPFMYVSYSLLLFSHSVVSDSAAPWTAAHQASLSFTISWRLRKLMSIESMMPSSHLSLCRPIFLPPSVFPSMLFVSSLRFLCPCHIFSKLSHRSVKSLSTLFLDCVVSIPPPPQSLLKSSILQPGSGLSSLGFLCSCCSGPASHPCLCGSPTSWIPCLTLSISSFNRAHPPVTS